MADLIPPVLITLVVLAVGVWYFLASKRYLRRKISRLPRVKVSELRPGTRVKVAGTVRLLGEPLQSPVYRQACAYWHVEVQVQEYSTTVEGMVWYSLRTKQNQIDFVLHDETGDVRVAVDHSQIEATTAQLRASKYDTELPPHLSRFLEENGHPRKDERGRDRVFGFEEGIIGEGEAVEIVATVHTGPDGGLVLAGTLKAPLLVLDSEV